MSRLAKQLGVPPLPRQLSPLRRYRTLDFPFRSALPPKDAPFKPQPAKFGADYDAPWARSVTARKTRAVIVDGPFRLAIAGLAAPIRKGQDRLATLEGAAIFAANHHSHLDTPLLLTSIPKPWRNKLLVGAAADYFFNNRATSALSAAVFGAMPIERRRLSRTSADRLADLVEKGWSLLLFPEGGRSPDGWGQPFRAGAAYLANRTSKPVVPIHIEGTGRILRKGKMLPNPSNTWVTFGSPLYPKQGESTARFSTRIEAAVSALADEANTDWYQARLRAHSNATPVLTGPFAGDWRRVWALGDLSRSSRKRSRRWPKS